MAPADPRNTARMHEPWSDVGIAGFDEDTKSAACRSGAVRTVSGLIAGLLQTDLCAAREDRVVHREHPAVGRARRHVERHHGLNGASRLDFDGHRPDPHGRRVIGAELLVADLKLLIRRKEALGLVTDISHF